MKDEPRSFAAHDILYEDDDVIVVTKLAGIPTQRTVDPKRRTLDADVARFLEMREGHEVRLAVHHRLDRDTSGVVVFGKSKRANRGLTEAFRARLAQKWYLAVVSGRPESATWEVKNHLRMRAQKDAAGGNHARGKAPKARVPKRNVPKGNVRRQEVVRSGGDFAHTTFVLLEAGDEVSLVRAHLHTGRTHQIRVHLAESGHPLVGDTLYGASTAKLASRREMQRFLLHAERLEMPHPVTGTPMAWVAPPPRGFEAFEVVLRVDAPEPR